jgi:archaellum biogenesis protein FlaJ (TadC family)
MEAFPIIFYRRYITSYTSFLLVLIFLISLDTKINNHLSLYSTSFVVAAAEITNLPGLRASYPLDAHAWKSTQQTHMYNSSSSI